MSASGIIDYVSPITNLTATRYALLFGSRYAQHEICGAAYRLFKKGLFSRLLISGGCTASVPVPEADELSEIIVKLGMPKNAIILERQALHTGENVEYAKEILPASTDELFLIGKIFAKRRYVMTVKKRWPAIKKVSCVGCNYFPVPRRHWHANDDLRNRVLIEHQKMLDYAQKGMIAEVGVKARHFVL